MRIEPGLLDAILAQAREAYPLESCGVLLGPPPSGAGGGGGSSLRVRSVVPVANREAESPRVRFQIAPEDLLRVQREARARGEEILGYYHSHPDHPARPSETDRRIAAQGLSDGVVHVIVGVAGDRATATAWIFREAAGRFEPEALQVE